MSRPPFIHKYKTADGLYVYDVNTNALLKANPLEFELVDDFTVLSEDELASKWSGRADKEEIRKAVKNLTEIEQKGYLSSNRPTGFVQYGEYLDELLNSQMEQLILNITETCNLRCRYCLYSGTYPMERLHSSKNMSLDTAKRAIKYFKEHSGNKERYHLSFYGGEPLTCFDTVKHAIEYTESLGDWGDLFVHVDSNGTLLNEDIIRFLVDHKIALQVSVDGPREVHDRFRVYRNGKGTYDRIMRNVSRIRELDEGYYQDHVYFVATLTPPYDLIQIDEFFGNGIHSNNTLSANFMETYDTEFFEKHTDGLENLADKSLAKIKEEYVAARSEGREPSKLAVALIDQAMIRLHRRGSDRLGETMPLNGCCVPGVRRVFVTADGELYPCEKVESKEFMIGNIETGIDRNLVERLIDRYAEESVGDCANCWASRVCSLCYTSAKHGDKFDIERKRERCQRQRNTWDGMLQMYTEILEQNPKAFDFVKDLYIE